MVSHADRRVLPFLAVLVPLTVFGVSPLAAQSVDPAASAATKTAAEANSPPPVPANRAEMLAALEALKARGSRLPLPAVEATATEEGREVVHNRTIREHYLGAMAGLRSSTATANTSTPPNRPPSTREPSEGEDYRFVTQLFWIVSRLNDCHYCLGHQESKLRRAGLEEGWLLALDTDWQSFPPAQQAAFEFTRRLTVAPHRIGDEDIESLRAHFSDDELLRIIYQVGRYNAMNRWTDATGIPQESYRDFSSELPTVALNLASRVAIDAYPRREPPVDFERWQAGLAAAASRNARVRPTAEALASGDADLASWASAAGTAVNEKGQAAAAADWLPHERLLAAIRGAGASVVRQVRDTFSLGSLDRLLKIKLAMAAAIRDDARYMQLVLLDPLRSAGFDDAQAFALGSGGTAGVDSDAERIAIAFAIRLTTNPIAIGDPDIQELLEHFSPQETAEIIHVVGTAAMLNRVTEAIALSRAENFSP